MQLIHLTPDHATSDVRPNRARAGESTRRRGATLTSAALVTADHMWLPPSSRFSRQLRSGRIATHSHLDAIDIVPVSILAPHERNGATGQCLLAYVPSPLSFFPRARAPDAAATAPCCACAALSSNLRPSLTALSSTLLFLSSIPSLFSMRSASSDGDLMPVGPMAARDEPRIEDQQLQWFVARGPPRLSVPGLRRGLRISACVQTSAAADPAMNNGGDCCSGLSSGRKSARGVRVHVRIDRTLSRARVETNSLCIVTL